MNVSLRTARASIRKTCALLLTCFSIAIAGGCVVVREEAEATQVDVDIRLELNVSVVPANVNDSNDSNIQIGLTPITDTVPMNRVQITGTASSNVAADEPNGE